MTIAGKPVFLTPEGHAKAVEELRYLKQEKRRAVAEKISSAKELGDLSENAEYSAAKEEQAFTEARINELENLIKYAEVVAEPTHHETTVRVGSSVTVESGQGKKTYTVAGFNEADPATGRISNESPLGQALMGKHRGEEFTYQTPAGPRTLKVIAID